MTRIYHRKGLEQLSELGKSCVLSKLVLPASHDGKVGGAKACKMNKVAPRARVSRTPKADLRSTKLY